MPKPVGAVSVGIGGNAKITFSPYVGHFILGDTDGAESGQGAQAKRWAWAPAWAGGGKSDNPKKKDQGKSQFQGKGKHPGGTFFVGVGGSGFAKKGLFGPMPGGFGINKGPSKGAIFGP